jgi:hypothetical protein
MDFIKDNTMLQITQKGDNDYIVKLIHTHIEIDYENLLENNLKLLPKKDGKVIEGAYEWVKCNMNNGKLKVRKGVYLSSSMYDGSHFCRKVKIGDKLIL